MPPLHAAGRARFGLLLLSACVNAGQPERPMATEQSMTSPTPAQAALVVAQEAGSLRWRLVNGPEPRWYFLLVPREVDGELSFAVDSAWARQDQPDGPVVLSKTQPATPARLRGDLVQVGAVRLGPGEAREGALGVGPHVELRGAYDAALRLPTVSPTAVQLEVGFLPDAPGAPKPLEQRDWEGQPFAIFDGDPAAAAQGLLRSEVVPWDSAAAR